MIVRVIFLCLAAAATSVPARRLTAATVALFAMHLLVAGCADTGVNSPGGGLLGGRVTLFTEEGAPIANRSGVVISLEGTPYATFTDSSGKWRLPGVPDGSYNVVASLFGYGYQKFLDYPHRAAAVDTFFGHVLIHAPTYSLTEASVSLGVDTVFCRATSSNQVGYHRFVLIYFGRQDPVADSGATWLEEVDADLEAGTSAFVKWFRTSELLGAGFAHGDTVHAAFYPASSFYETYVAVPDSKRINTSGVGPTARRLTIVLP